MPVYREILSDVLFSGVLLAAAWMMTGFPTIHMAYHVYMLKHGTDAVTPSVRLLLALWVSVVKPFTREFVINSLKLVYRTATLIGIFFAGYMVLLAPIIFTIIGFLSEVAVLISELNIYKLSVYLTLLVAAIVSSYRAIRLAYGAVYRAIPVDDKFLKFVMHVYTAVITIVYTVLLSLITPYPGDDGLVIYRGSISALGLMVLVIHAAAAIVATTGAMPRLLRTHFGTGELHPIRAVVASIPRRIVYYLVAFMILTHFLPYFVCITVYELYQSG